MVTLLHVGCPCNLGQSGGSVNGPLTEDLLRREHAQEGPPEIIQRQKEDDEAEPSPAQPLIDSLTKRELEILHLIAEGLKNKEIAEQLVISLNTVLYHIKNIYSKLNVHGRAEAVVRAEELNLL